MRPYSFLFLLFGVTLIFFGAGCVRSKDRLPKIPLTNNLHTLTQEEIAHENELAESETPDMTVALILTENAESPEQAVLGPNIGCNDRVAFIKTHRSALTSSVPSDALRSLFSLKESNINGLYNSLWQSDLTVEKIQSRDGVTTEVWIRGQIASSGACDDPRIKAQIEETVRRFRPHVKIFLNGSEEKWKCVGDQSGKCTTL